MDIVLGAAHLHQADDKDSKKVTSIFNVPMTNPLPSTDNIIEELIFKSKDVVCAVFQDVDLTMADGKFVCGYCGGRQ